MKRVLWTKQTSPESYTFIWFSAESFRPDISKTFTPVVIGRPYFFDAVGYKKKYASEKNHLKNSEVGSCQTQILTKTMRSRYSLIWMWDCI
jgi:hypothetical protein